VTPPRTGLARATVARDVLLPIVCSHDEGTVAHAVSFASEDIDGVLCEARRLRLEALVAHRLLALSDWSPAVRDRLAQVVNASEKAGFAAEMLTREVLGALERDGIRAHALKGALLARDLFGSPGLRAPGDIDILVSRGQLSAACATVASLGWMLEARTNHGLPELHERLVHPRLPAVELHWRLHWYATRFSSNALERASTSGRARPLRLDPVDEIVALLLYYSRDGFVGLRPLADLSQWNVAQGRSVPPGALEPIALEYPELAPSLRAGIAAAAVAVDLSRLLAFRPTRREAFAVAMMDPYARQLPSRSTANASLIDVLLAPPGEIRGALQREFLRAPNFAPPDTRLRDTVTNVERAARVGRRWLLASLRGLPSLARRRGVDSAANSLSAALARRSASTMTAASIARIWSLKR
jgi:Uncharacterised nucleotidyltransferase